jgi:Ser/Thr protein kinase RdoA (MazF antagonist)
LDLKIKAAFTPPVKTELFQRCGVEETTAVMLDGFESFIFEGSRNGTPCIVRISHSLHRSPEMIHAEAEWIDHLAQHGLTVGRPLRGMDGELVQSLEVDNGTFTATLFTKVPGDHPHQADWEGDSLMTALGHLVGKMHAIAKDFEPSNPEYERPTWDEDIAETLKKFEQLPPQDAPLVNRFKQIAAHLRDLPRGMDDYGLIHFDVHGGNFYLADGQVWLFDFDDCCYNWFANDIAMVLFYAAPFECDTPEQAGLMQQRFQAFMRAYQQENQLDPEWFDEIVNFMTLREIDLYAAILRDIPVEEYDRWVAGYMHNRRERIMARQPFIPLDFRSLV